MFGRLHRIGEILQGLGGFQCVFSGGHGREGWGAHGTPNVKAQKYEATWYVQSNNRIDIAACERECEMGRVTGEATRGRL